MGVDISTYRGRIGLFGPGRGYGGHHSHARYNPCTTGSVIHYQMSATCLVILYVISSGILLANTLHSTTTIATDDVFFPVNIDIHQGSTIFSRCLCYAYQTQLSLPTYKCYSQNKLILSMDVETNPGPMSEEDKRFILNAISSQCGSIKTDIDKIHNDTTQIRSDVESIRETCDKMKHRVEHLEEKNHAIEEKLEGVNTDVRGLIDERENLFADMYALNEICDRQRDKIDVLETAVDRLERDKLKSSMRIFGLKEASGETNNDLKAKLTNNVLNVACPEHTWDESSIADVFRVGKHVNNKDRIVIVKFSSIEEKHLLYKKRDILRHKGIRISEELTSRERDVMSNLRRNGRSGYFKNGKLHIRPENENRNQSQRYIASATRRIQSQSTAMETGTPRVETDAGSSHER